MSIFNWYYLLAASDAASSAAQQATAAQETLNELKKDASNAQLIRRTTAYAALKALARNARTRRAPMYSPNVGNDLTLIPDNWTDFELYIAVQRPLLNAEVRMVEQEAIKAEAKMIKFLTLPHAARSTVSASYDSLEKDLNKTENGAEGILKLLRESED